MNQLPRFTEEEIQAEIDLLLAQQDRPWNRFEAKCGRFIIRTLRILCGITLFVGFLYCADSALTTLNIPFAEQSIVGIGGALFMGYLAFLLGKWAWASAFGPAPTRAEKYEALRNRALGSLTIKRPAGMSLPTTTE